MHPIFLLLFLFFFVSVHEAAAAEQPANTQRVSNSACGATIADALAQARLSLAATGPSSERTALGCLIEAVSKLEQDDMIIKRADGNKVLNLPQSPGDPPLQSSQPRPIP